MKSGIVLEAMLAFWVSWYVLPSGPQDGIHPYVFPLAIKLSKVEQLALALIFLGSLFYHLDECIQNQLKSMGRYTVFFYANSAFLQLYLWERFKGLATQLVQFEAMNMVTIEDENDIVKTIPDKLEKMRAYRWFNIKQQKGKDLVDYIDSEKHFSFCPYASTPQGVAEAKLYADLGGSTVEISSKGGRDETPILVGNYYSHSPPLRYRVQDWDCQL